MTVSKTTLSTLVQIVYDSVYTYCCKNIVLEYNLYYAYNNYILGYILGINASVGIIVTHSSIQSPNFAYMQLEVEMLLILVTP